MRTGFINPWLVTFQISFSDMQLDYLFIPLKKFTCKYLFQRNRTHKKNRTKFINLNPHPSPPFQWAAGFLFLLIITIIIRQLRCERESSSSGVKTPRTHKHHFTKIMVPFSPFGGVGVSGKMFSISRPDSRKRSRVQSSHHGTGR